MCQWRWVAFEKNSNWRWRVLNKQETKNFEMNENNVCNE